MTQARVAREEIDHAGAGWCAHCAQEARASTPAGRMCGGHALVEATRQWNQGNWGWTFQLDHDEHPTVGQPLTRLFEMR